MCVWVSVCVSVCVCTYRGLHECVGVCNEEEDVRGGQVPCAGAVFFVEGHEEGAEG